ncbi:MAG: hypothetical protein RQ867_10560 [Mariprofundaceae bacterium]|nr:hypothetical protein [Mariprofundaceae bacterium]
MTKMTKKKRELLAEIESSEAVSIYQLARRTGRNYRRVHDHVQEFIEAGLVQVRSEVCNGRRALIVESECHQRLKRLNDMYTFKAGLDAAR